jgi:hypothetical protein
LATVTAALRASGGSFRAHDLRRALEQEAGLSQYAAIQVLKELSKAGQISISRSAGRLDRVTARAAPGGKSLSVWDFIAWHHGKGQPHDVSGESRDDGGKWTAGAGAAGGKLSKQDRAVARTETKRAESKRQGERKHGRDTRTGRAETAHERMTDAYDSLSPFGGGGPVGHKLLAQLGNAIEYVSSDELRGKPAAERQAAYQRVAEQAAYALQKLKTQTVPEDEDQAADHHDAIAALQKIGLYALTAKKEAAVTTPVAGQGKALASVWDFLSWHCGKALAHDVSSEARDRTGKWTTGSSGGDADPDVRRVGGRVLRGQSQMAFIRGPELPPLSATPSKVVLAARGRPTPEARVADMDPKLRRPAQDLLRVLRHAHAETLSAAAASVIASQHGFRGKAAERFLQIMQRRGAVDLFYDSQGGVRGVRLRKRPLRPDAKGAGAKSLSVWDWIGEWWCKKEWNESLHPRGQPENAGQWGPGGGHAEIKPKGGAKPASKPRGPDLDKPNARTGLADRARVGVPAMSVPPPPARIPVVPNLAPEQRKVEKSFIKSYLKHPKRWAKRYLQALADREVGEYPNVFATDDVKMLNSDWNPADDGAQAVKEAMAANNVAVHQTANAICKRAFLKYLDDTVSKLPEDRRTVLVTNGGCAAGKGSSTARSSDPDDPHYGMLPVSDQVGAIWDSAGEQCGTENEWVYEECKKRGIKPIFAYVWADPKDTWDGEGRGVIRRAIRKGRMVSAELFADSYAKGAKNMKAFVDKHKGDPDARFIFLDNRDKKAPKRLDAFPDETLKWDEKAIYNDAVASLKKRAHELDPALVAAGLATV